MVLLISVLSVIGSLLFTPLLMVLLGIIFLASIGKSLGVRKMYINVLLMLFEYGRMNIETAQKRTRKLEESADGENQSTSSADTGQGDQKSQELQNAITAKPLTTFVAEYRKAIAATGTSKASSANGVLVNGNHLLNREDKLLLFPEPPVTIAPKATLDGAIVVDKPLTQVEELQHDDEDNKSTDGKEKYKDFELSHCFDLIKAGMEAIIEDEVTSRFEAEELKNWNMLTRTNRRYEFVSWRLTVIWMCGFFIRYFFLLPLRVLICCIGVNWMIVTTCMVGLLPDGFFKRYLNHYCYVVAFRIMSRSLSGMIHIYNPQYRPGLGCVCVANHTSPVDVLILSTDNSYSLVMWLTICTAAVAYLPDGNAKERINRYVQLMCFGILTAALSAVITYHNCENAPKGGICVANHTSPIDALVLLCDNCYSLIGQKHGGFLGVLQRALARASPHIWFERSEVKDRHAVARKLREHVSNPRNPPILIFPEGTCINNTSVMQFKKGSFEVGSVICPVAIKYDPRFGDAFWNSSKYSMIQYLYMMMTSWAIVCEVWYLPPMYQREGESAIDFANRVKGVIALQGGLVDLVWDGQLKRTKPKKEWKERQQEEFSKFLKCE